MPKKDSQKMFNKCYVARKLVGLKGVSQQRFADLTGVHKTVIARRETKGLGINGTCSAVYTLITALGSESMDLRADIEKALESVKEGERGEEKALAALILLAIDKGMRASVSRVLGGGPEEGEEVSPRTEIDYDATISTVTTIRKSIEKIGRRRADEQDDGAAREYREAADALVVAERRLAGLKNEASSVRDDPGGGDG